MPRPPLRGGSSAGAASLERRHLRAALVGRPLAARREHAAVGAARCATGTMPGISCSRPEPATRGTAPSRPIVYGWRGSAYSSSTSRLLDLAPGVHDDDAVGDVRHHAEVVRDQHDRHPEPRPQVLHHVEHARLDGHVERRRRLVGDQHLRLAGDRHRDHHPLAHAARELVRVLAQRASGAGMPTSSSSSTARVRAAPLDIPRWRRSTSPIWPPDGEHRVQRGHRLLEDHRDPPPAHAPAPSGRAGPRRPSRARPLTCARRPQQAEQRHRGHALAAARLADDRQRAAVLDRERDVLDRLHRAALARRSGRTGPRPSSISRRSSGRARRAARRRAG